MIAEYKSKANKVLIIGFLVWFIGNVFKHPLTSGGQYTTLGVLAWWAGVVVFVYGCSLYAKAKGQHWAWGLLGVLSLIGLIILYFLPDKNKQKK
jgi:hypothetical protein